MNKFITKSLPVTYLSKISFVPTNKSFQETASQSKKRRLIKLGKKLENPYSTQKHEIGLQNLKVKMRN
jgi:hypothetical protein